jgi:hypothetical protein
MAPWLIITGSGLDDWIYWPLLLQSLLITISYSGIANLPTSQITRTLSILVLVLRYTALYSVVCPLIIPRHAPHENTVFCYQECLFIGSLPSSRCHIVPRVCFYWNVCSDPLPSNGNGGDHIAIFFSIVACAYLGRCLEMYVHVTIHFKEPPAPFGIEALYDS